MMRPSLPLSAAPATVRGWCPAIDQRGRSLMGRSWYHEDGGPSSHLVFVEPDRREPVVPGELGHTGSA
jgi:hypothetical protein